MEYGKHSLPFSFGIAGLQAKHRELNSVQRSVVDKGCSA